MTTNVREPSRYELDVADATTAHKLEARAKAAIESLPGAAADILARTVKNNGTRSNPTRASGAVALREVVREYAAAEKAANVPRSPETAAMLASRLLKGADAHYWAMVTRHDRMILKDAGACMYHGAFDFDDTVQLLRIGWYRGAMRYDPTRGFKFPTMARRWGAVFETVNRDRGPVKTSNKKDSKFPSVSYIRLDAPHTFGNDDGSRVGDNLRDEDIADGDSDADIQFKQRLAWVISELEKYTPGQRRAITAMYLAGGNVNDEDQYACLIDVARTHGVTKSAISLSHRSGILRLRDALRDQEFDDMDGEVEPIASVEESWSLFAPRVDESAA